MAANSFLKTATTSVTGLDMQRAYQVLCDAYASHNDLLYSIEQSGTSATLKAVASYKDEANRLLQSANQLVTADPRVAKYVARAPKIVPTTGTEQDLRNVSEGLRNIREAYGRLSELAEQRMDVAALAAQLADTQQAALIRRSPRFRLYPLDWLILAVILLIAAILITRFIVAPYLVKSSYEAGIQALVTNDMAAAVTDFRYVITNDIDNRFTDKQLRLSSAYSGLVQAALDDAAWDRARTLIAEWRAATSVDKATPIDKLFASYFLPAEKAYKARQWPETRRLLDQLAAVRSQENAAKEYKPEETTYYLSSLSEQATELIAQKKWDEAQTLLEQLRQRDPASAVARQLLLTSYYSQALEALNARNWDQARNFVSAGLNSYPSTGNSVSRADSTEAFIPQISLAQVDALTLIEIRYESYLRPGQAALDSGQYEEARQQFDILLRLTAAFTTPYKQVDKLRLETFYRPAVAAFNKGDWKAAQQAFLVKDLLVYTAPENVNVGYQRSVELLRQSFLMPARDLAKANQWRALQAAIGPYYTARETYKLKDDQPNKNGKSTSRELFVLWKDSYFWAGVAAYYAGDFDTARQQFLSAPLVGLQPYDDDRENPTPIAAQGATANQPPQVIRNPREFLEASFTTPAMLALARSDWPAVQHTIDDLKATFDKLNGSSAGTTLPESAQWLKLQSYFLPGFAAYLRGDWQAVRTLLNRPELLGAGNPDAQLAAFPNITSATTCVLIKSYTDPASANLDSNAFELARTDLTALLSLEKFNPSRCLLKDYGNASVLLRQTYFLPAKQINDRIAAYDLDTTRRELPAIIKDLGDAKANIGKLLALDGQPGPAESKTPGTAQTLASQSPAFSGAYAELRRTTFLLASAQLTTGNLPEARAALLELIAIDGWDSVSKPFEGVPALLGRAFSDPAFALAHQQSPDWPGVIVLLEPLSDINVKYPAPGYLDVSASNTLADAYYQEAVALSQEAMQSSDITKIDKMIVLIEKLGKLKKDYPGAATLLLQATYTQAKVLFDHGDYKAARERLKSLIEARAANADLSELDPYFSDAATLLREAYYTPAKAAFDKGDWKTAQAELGELLKVIPQNSDYRDARSMLWDTYYNQAKQQQANKQFKEAVATLDALIELAPNYRDARIVRNDILFAAAKDTFDRKDYDGARKWLDTLLIDEPYYPGALKLRRATFVDPASSAIADKKWQSARETLGTLLKQDAAYADGELQYRDTFLKEATEYYQNGQWENARQVLTGILSRDRNYPDARVQDIIKQLDRLYRLTYYTPGRKAYDAKVWAAVPNFLVPLVKETQGGAEFKPEGADLTARQVLINSYENASDAAVEIRAYGPAETALRTALALLANSEDDKPIRAKLTTKLIDKVLRPPAKEAMDAKDWGTAQQKDELILALDSSLEDVWSQRFSTYLIPASDALKAGNWGVARALYQKARELLTPGAAPLFPKELADKDTFKTLLDQANIGYYNSYYLPGKAALDAGDWIHARSQFLLPLYERLQADRGNAKYDEFKDLASLLIETYKRPILDAIKRGNVKVAQSLLDEFQKADAQNQISAKLPRRDQYDLEQLDVNLIRIPLQASLDRQDWETAANEFIELRNKRNVDNVLLDETIVKYPQLVSALARANTRFWLTGISATAAPTPVVERQHTVYTALGLSSGSSRIITGDLNGVVYVRGQYGAKESFLAIQTNTSYIANVVVDPNGYWFITTGADQDARVWRISNGQQLRKLTGHTGYISAVAVDAAGGQVATGSFDGTVRIWHASADWDKLAEPLVLTMNKSQRVTAVQFTPDAKLLVVATADGLLSLWDIQGQRKLAQTTDAIAYVHDILFRPGTASDGAAWQLVTIGNEAQIHIWKADNTSIQAVGTLKKHAATAWVRAAAFVSDGTVLATVGTDNKILLWNMVTQEVAVTLTTNTTDIADMHFSEDASQLIAINLGGGTLKWSSSDGK